MPIEETYHHPKVYQRPQSVARISIVTANPTEGGNLSSLPPVWM